MFNKLKDGFNCLVSVGIEPGLSYFEVIKLRMINSQTVFIGLILIFFAVRDYDSPGGFVSLFILLLFSLIFVFNYYKKYVTARMYWLIFFPSIAVVLSYLFGSELRMDYAYIHFGLSCLIFFDTFRNRLLVVLYVFFNFLLSLYVTENFEGPLANGVQPYDKAILFIVSMLCIVNVFVVVFEGLRKNYAKLTLREKELENKNEELERFTYIASHDLKEPLRNIIGFSQLMDRYIEKEDYKSTEEFAKIIGDNARQMSDLIVGSLEVLSVDKKELVYGEVDLNEIIANIKALLGDSFNNKKVQLEILNPLPIVKAHHYEMLACLKNLIENAIKYNDKAFPKIVLDATEEKMAWLVSVRDNGKGIDKEYFDQIFELFKRLENRNKYAGSGLGLSICKKIINGMGGDIWVDSSSSKGTTFKIRIPK